MIDPERPDLEEVLRGFADDHKEDFHSIIDGFVETLPDITDAVQDAWAEA